MKTKDVGPLMKAITEAVNDPNAPDPFEPIPLPLVHDKSTPEEREIQQLTAEQQHIVEKMTSLKAKANIIDVKYGGTPAYGVYVSANRPFTYNTNKKAKHPAGFVAFDSNVYNLSKLPQKIGDWLSRYGPMYSTLSSRKSAIDRKIKNIKSSMDVAAVTAMATSNQSGQGGAGNQIPVAQIPRKLRTGPAGSLIDNPYFKSAEYAGPPVGYKFSTPMRTIFVSLESTLRRHGLTLGTLYVGRHGGVGGPINFVTATANNNIVWRKYDAGGASGQNWLYLNGARMNTSSFIRLTEAQRDAALKLNGVI